MIHVRVQEAPFDLGAEAAKLTGPDVGAVVTFSGLVRDVSDGLRHMEIEHYPAMTEAAITKMVEDALARWSVSHAVVIHRFGRVGPGDQIMMVATAARHRVDAFQAAEFLMDYLKSRAPFWKKEVTQDGANWVEARDIDEDALKRW